MTSIIDQFLEKSPNSERTVRPLNIPRETPIGAVQQDQPPSDPDRAVTWMNERHFVVREAGKTVVLTEEIDPELHRRVLKRSSFDDINKFYCNRSLNSVDPDGKTRKTALGKYWLNDKRRRQYAGIVCAPRGDAPGYYNLWQGFSVRPSRGDWSLMNSHIPLCQ